MVSWLDGVVKGSIGHLRMTLVLTTTNHRLALTISLLNAPTAYMISIIMRHARTKEIHHVSAGYLDKVNEPVELNSSLLNLVASKMHIGLSKL
jgi:hypothetical protein